MIINSFYRGDSYNYNIIDFEVDLVLDFEVDLVLDLVLNRNNNHFFLSGS